MRFQIAANTGHYPVPGPFAANVDVAVVRVATEPVAPTLQLPIQFGQEDIVRAGVRAGRLAASLLVSD